MTDPNNRVASTTPSFQIVARMIEQLSPLSESDRAHVLATVATWFKISLWQTAIGDRISLSSSSRATPSSGSDSSEQFAERPEISPKEFILEKDPRTDVERMAALGYYLTHFRNTPHFKTNDLSRLNTEAAQRKFANAANTAKNAMRDGFFVAAPKGGSRQLSAFGERYVQALPDRDAAEEVRKRLRSRRPRRNGTAQPGDRTDEDLSVDDATQGVVSNASGAQS